MKKYLLWISVIVLIPFFLVAQDSVETKDDIKTTEQEQKQDKVEATDTQDSQAKDSATVEEKAAAGALTIYSEPDSAVLLVDDVAQGKTPMTLTGLSVGKHVIMLKKKGHFVKKATIELSAGDDKEITLQLAKPGTLTVTSEPSDAIIMLNKKKVGSTPYSSSKLKPGDVSLLLLKEGYEKQQQSLTLASGGKDSIHVVLPSVAKSVETKAPKKEEPQKEEPEKKVKDSSKITAILDKFALGIFVTFSLVILIIELAQKE